MMSAKETWEALERDTGDEFIHEAYINATPPMKTGIETLDGALRGGLKPGMTLIAAQPGTGKSGLALDCAASIVGSTEGARALYFSLEMDYAQCRLRLLAWLASTYGDELGLEPFIWSDLEPPAKGTTIEEMREAGDPVVLANDAFTERFDDRLRIVDNVSTLDEICEIVSSLCDGKRRKLLVVIDYLQLVRAEGCATEYDNVTEVSHGLARIAKENAIPIIALSSMNREQGKSENRKAGTASNPMGSARGSGHAEFDAQAVVRLTKGVSGYIGVTVPKNRGGKPRTNPLYMKFDGAHHVFYSAGKPSD